MWEGLLYHPVLIASSLFPQNIAEQQSIFLPYGTPGAAPSFLFPLVSQTFTVAFESEEVFRHGSCTERKEPKQAKEAINI